MRNQGTMLCDAIYLYQYKELCKNKRERERERLKEREREREKIKETVGLVDEKQREEDDEIQTINKYSTDLIRNIHHCKECWIIPRPRVWGEER